MDDGQHHRQRAKGCPEALLRQSSARIAALRLRPPAARTKPMSTTLSISAVVGLLVVVLEIYAIVLAITRTNGVERTLAWIFGIIAVPGFGAVAFQGLPDVTGPVVLPDDDR